MCGDFASGFAGAWRQRHAGKASDVMAVSSSTLLLTVCRDRRVPGHGTVLVLSFLMAGEFLPDKRSSCQDFILLLLFIAPLKSSLSPAGLVLPRAASCASAAVRRGMESDGVSGWQLTVSFYVSICSLSSL